ncbi:MAG: xanthine dehydrogenase subunit D [Geodermatophilaceae bacterium]
MSVSTDTVRRTPGGVGDSPVRPDGTFKVSGQFAYSSDLYMDGMLWGTTLRSPHPRARIRSIDVGAALKLPGVSAVLTHEDVPGEKVYGLEIADQPVLAFGEVRYQGEPVAIVAADHPETARRAATLIVVDYDVVDPVCDPREAVGHPFWKQVHDEPGERTAMSRDKAPVHPEGNIVRHQRVRFGDPDAATADVVVHGDYEVGMQDQAFLGPESGLAVPGEDGGVDLYVATQWLHVDRRQMAGALRLPEEKIRLTLAGVGGAFGAREDLSMQVHACMLALRTGRPVKMVYSREESFFGHVHRHPALMRYEHGADREGRLVYVRAHVLLDGGAYTSSTPAVVGNASTLGVGPYVIPHVAMDAWGVYTNNPPCGAMRGFGAVQAAFAYESQMDKLAAAVGVSPVEIRIRNAMSEGSILPTGQVIDSPAPVADLMLRLEAMPLPAPAAADIRLLPGGVSNTTHGEGVRRGVGYAIGIKNVGFSEGFDDFSTARVRLELVGDEPSVLVHTAAVEVGQGLVTVQAQIARSELGVERVTIAAADTQVGSGGSTSASRQTYVTGGAVRAACEGVRSLLIERAVQRYGEGEYRLVDGQVESLRDGVVGDIASLLLDGAVERTAEWRHRPTHPVDEHTGRGDAHVQWAFCAHRAVVDVDVELGLIRVVELAAVQDVGKAMNPDAVLGQIHGGSAQGLGLAVMEEVQLLDGKLRNPSFTDYLIPTIMDMPPMRVEVLELADPHAPYGLRGVGEPPTISSTPAIVAAVRAASGVDLKRVPIRPEHLVAQGSRH